MLTFQDSLRCTHCYSLKLRALHGIQVVCLRLLPRLAAKVLTAYLSLALHNMDILSNQPWNKNRIARILRSATWSPLVSAAASMGRGECMEYNAKSPE